jgi:hypothetical protein
LAMMLASSTTKTCALAIVFAPFLAGLYPFALDPRMLGLNSVTPLYVEG